MINTILDEKVKLIEYLPPIMKTYKEFIDITSTEDEELNLIYELLKKELFNNFISTCDIETIRVYEKLLNLEVDEAIDIDTRKFNVFSKWNGELPYTKNTLIKKLDFLLGPESYKLNIDNDNYKVSIITQIINENKKLFLINALRSMIPANMIIVNDNILNISLENDIYISGAISEYKSYRIGE